MKKRTRNIFSNGAGGGSRGWRFPALCLLLAAVAFSCAVKTNPEKPNENFPRSYPVK